jgi:hypothetical protein
LTLTVVPYPLCPFVWRSVGVSFKIMCYLKGDCGVGPRALRATGRQRIDHGGRRDSRRLYGAVVYPLTTSMSSLTPTPPFFCASFFCVLLAACVRVSTVGAFYGRAVASGRVSNARERAARALQASKARLVRGLPRPPLRDPPRGPGSRRGAKPRRQRRRPAHARPHRAEQRTRR